MKNIKNKIIAALFLVAFVVSGCDFGDNFSWKVNSRYKLNNDNRLGEIK